jgi:hypothetical protein
MELEILPVLFWRGDPVGGPIGRLPGWSYVQITQRSQPAHRGMKKAG